MATTKKGVGIKGPGVAWKKEKSKKPKNKQRAPKRTPPGSGGGG